MKIHCSFINEDICEEIILFCPPPPPPYWCKFIVFEFMDSSMELELMEGDTVPMESAELPMRLWEVPMDSWDGWMAAIESTTSIPDKENCPLDIGNSIIVIN